MDHHNNYMQRCMQLAILGAGQVSPNPMVGAVIVHDDKIIGEGYHRQYGGPHAEVNAVNMVIANHADAQTLLAQATIYVSLEPCAHYGKTPPCADMIIKYRIPNVVIGCRDPFGQVNGKGIEKLEAAGINVITGILEQQCLELNKRFFTRVKLQRPYVILKWAQTADGFFAPDNGSQHWITGQEARILVHKWRSEEDAILIGKNTAIADNPKLDTRLWHGKPPKRIVIDRNLLLSHDLNIFDQSVETFIFNAVKTAVENNIKYIALEDFNKYVPQYILYQLYLQDVQSVIIEGGAYTLNRFIEAGLWDEARIFTGETVLRKGIKSPGISGKPAGNYKIAADNLQIIYNSRID